MLADGVWSWGSIFVRNPQTIRQSRDSISHRHGRRCYNWEDRGIEKCCPDGFSGKGAPIHANSFIICRQPKFS